MANTFSALKRTRTAEHRTEVNQMRKSRFRHQVRSIRRLIESNDAAGAEKALPETFSMVDRAAKWGIIKKNTAARYKSRLIKRVKALAAA